MGEAADLVFRSKTNSADYHDEMNHEHYIEWLTEQLLPNIHYNSAIVLSNATYHNKLRINYQQRQTGKKRFGTGYDNMA